MDYPFEMIEFREFFCGSCPFGMTIISTVKSFSNDKKDDCHSESKQREKNPLSSFLKESHPSRRENHLHLEETVIFLISKGKPPSFQNDSFAYDSSSLNLK